MQAFKHLITHHPLEFPMKFLITATCRYDLPRLRSVLPAEAIAVGISTRPGRQRYEYK